MDEREGLLNYIKRNGVWYENGQWVFAYVGEPGRLPIRVSSLNYEAVEWALSELFDGVFDQLCFERLYETNRLFIKAVKKDICYAHHVNIRELDLQFKRGYLLENLEAFRYQVFNEFATAGINLR